MYKSKPGWLENLFNTITPMIAVVWIIIFAIGYINFWYLRPWPKIMMTLLGVLFIIGFISSFISMSFERRRNVKHKKRVAEIKKIYPEEFKRFGVPAMIYVLHRADTINAPEVFIEKVFKELDKIPKLDRYNHSEVKRVADKVEAEITKNQTSNFGTRAR